MAWGSLIHALLEHAMRGPHRERAHLERVANWLTLGNPELRRVVPEALDTVTAVMEAEFWERAMAAENPMVEVPLAVRLEAHSGPPRILYGVVDLTFETPDGRSLIDYKTDHADTAALALRYREQVQHYVQQWHRLDERPTVFAGLYSVFNQQLSENLVNDR
jgi:ATP-dependent exoDNAse (exonuclease V) beta subunit